MRRSTFAAILISFLPSMAFAADVTMPASVARSVVQVVCADRQGSGALTRAGEGGSYVITAGHVVIDPSSGVQADECRIGFVADTAQPPTSFYRSSVVHAVFDLKTDRDFGVLRLGERLFGSDPIPAIPLKTQEFSPLDAAVTVLGFPSGHGSKMQASSGKILEFARGTIRTDAVISQGFSGGPAIDAAGDIVGVATRVEYSVDSTTGEQKPVDYQMGDIMSMIGWLDGFGPAEHDKFLTHADTTRFDGAPFTSRVENPGCAYVVRTRESPTVYCLLQGAFRLVFPNEATFASWFPDASAVRFVDPASLSDYRLISNVTMRAGTLVKVQTDPTVYVVTDSFGTLRAIPSEQRARDIFGEAWAGAVRDVPDAFFADYRIGAPLN